MPHRKVGTVGTQAIRPWIAAVDENGKTIAVVQAGDALAIRAAGLRPSILYSMTLRDQAGQIETNSIMSDRRGFVHDTVIWPQIGIDDPRDLEPIPVEKARKHWLSQAIWITLKDTRKKAVSKTKVTVSDQVRPL